MCRPWPHQKGISSSTAAAGFGFGLASPSASRKASEKNFLAVLFLHPSRDPVALATDRAFTLELGLARLFALLITEQHAGAGIFGFVIVDISVSFVSCLRVWKPDAT